MRTCIWVLMWFPLTLMSQTVKPTHVDVFKNGTGFFTVEGTLPILQGVAVLDHVPESVFGTFWVASRDKNVRVESVRAVYQVRASKKDAQSFYDALTANIGKRIIWHFQDEKQGTISGILQSVQGRDDRSMVTIKTAGPTHVLAASWYSWAEFPDAYVSQLPDTTRTAALEIRASGVKNELNLHMVYFQHGIGWIPSYRVDLIDDKNAQIVLSASLVNDAQDLTHTNLNFVVGYPNFMYQNTPTPLSLHRGLDEFMSQASRQENYPTYQRSMLANQMMMGESEMIADDPDYSSFRPLEGTSNEDLFFYRLDDVTLKKGERAQYSIFSATVPYSHIYEVDLPKALNQYDYEKKDTPHKVWHSVRLENKTTHPWTTGSGMTLQGGKALGQDIVYYTPPKNSVNLKITTSPDIIVKDEEKEVDRKESIKQKDGHYYDLLTIEGEVMVSNAKSKDIRLIVTRPVSGKILSISDEADVKQSATLRTPINPENSIKWDVAIKSQETKKLTYRYDIYLRR